MTIYDHVLSCALMCTIMGYTQDTLHVPQGHVVESFQERTNQALKAIHGKEYHKLYFLAAPIYRWLRNNSVDSPLYTMNSHYLESLITERLNSFDDRSFITNYGPTAVYMCMALQDNFNPDDGTPINQKKLDSTVDPSLYHLVHQKIASTL